MPALAKTRIWPSLGYEPHRGQRIIHASKARHRVNAGGRRGGKSKSGGHELTVEALYAYTLADALREAGKRREFWIVGPEYSDAEKEFRVHWNDLERLGVPFDHPGSYNNPINGEMHVSLWDGVYQVHAKSSKYPGTLVGEGLAGVVMAEAAKMKQAVWYKYIRPTLADFRGWSLFNSTPEGKNWFYDLWRRGQDPEDEDWQSWRMPSFINEFVFPKGATPEGIKMIRDGMRLGVLTPRLIQRSGVDEEVVDMMRDMTEERFNQEILALFTEYVGRVFKDFDEEIHVTDVAYNPSLPLYLAADYGWTNPTVVIPIQVDVWDTVYCLGEYRVDHRDIIDISKDLQTWRGGICKMATRLYPDPASPGDSNVLANALGLEVMGATGGELPDRIFLIRQWLKLVPEHVPWEERVPRLYLDRSILHGTREMNDWRYPETKNESREAPELPMKKDDHFPEALGRFYAGYFGQPEEVAGTTRVRKASVG